MKKTIYSLSILLGSFITAQQKVDVKVSYGAPSLFGISESITESSISVFTDVMFGKDLIIYDSNGVFAAEVMLHSKDDKWRYGIAYTNEKVTDDRNDLTGSFNTILAQADYSWLNPDNKFKLYSGAGVGALMANFDQGLFQDNNVIFAYNVTPIGVSYGRQFAVFLETNVGTKGFVQGGVSYTF